MQTPTPPSRLAPSVLLAALCLATLAAQAQTAYRWVGKDGQVHYADQPPPPAQASDVKEKKLSGNVIETGGPSYQERLAAQNFPLTLYTSANCKENCRIARDFLKRRGAAFSEKEIRTQEDADGFKKATGIDELRVPVLQAGSRSEQGYQEHAWNALLDAAGYPRDKGASTPPTPPR